METSHIGHNSTHATVDSVSGPKQPSSYEAFWERLQQLLVVPLRQAIIKRFGLSDQKEALLRAGVEPYVGLDGLYDKSLVLLATLPGFDVG